MNIKVLGFTWEIDPPENSIEHFLQYINSLNLVEMQNLGSMPAGVNYHRVVLTTDLDNGLWGGVFLTVKNARKFLRSQSLPKGKGKGYRISTGEIGSDENFADANFFIYNPKTKAGLYEYYHLSAHLNTFNYEFLSKFKHYRSIHNINGILRYSQFPAKSEFDQKVKELSAVHNVEYELSTITVPDADLVPASGMVKRQRIKVFYESRYQSTNELKDGLRAFALEKFDRIIRLFVKGKDSKGEDVSYSIMADPSVFDEREFKNYSVSLDVDENIDASLKASSNLNQLITISNKIKVRDFFYTEREP